MVPPDYHGKKVQRILEGDDMTDKEKEIVQALRCCAEGECKDCAMHEDKQRCQENLLDKAAEAIERVTAENADLHKKLEWKGMVIALEQREHAKAESKCKALINELCQYCGKYKYAHDGACDGCRWKEET